MLKPTPARVPARREPPPPSSPEVEAMLAQAAAWNAMAEAVKEGAAALRELKPAADGVHGLMEAQQKFCAFLVQHRVKLLLAVPGLLVAIGAIQPNAAHGLAEALKMWGLS